MMLWIRRLGKCETCISTALIGLVTLLAYAPLLNQLGFYKEDWYIIWSGIYQGKGNFIPLFTYDRPLEGYLYWLIYPFLGNNPLTWQIYALGVRIVGIYAFFWLVRQLWPEKKFATTAATVLLAIYPGFVQQPQANSFQVHLTAFSLALISMALTIYALRTESLWRKIPAIGVAMAMTLVYPMLMEYFIGLEAVRYMLIWYASYQQRSRPWLRSLGVALLRDLPYLAVTGLFLYWRLFMFTSERPTTNVDRLVGSYTVNILGMVVRFGVEYVKDVFETLLLAWTVPVNNFLYTSTYPNTLLTWGLALLAGLALVGYAVILRKRGLEQEIAPSDWQSNRAWVWIGVLAVMVALIPVIAANRDVKFIDREDRFTLPASLGVALAVTGILSASLRPRLRTTGLAVLVVLSVVAQFSHALVMRDFWEVQRQLWWQLSWRAPAIQPRTLLFVDLPPGFAFAEGYEAWAPANLVYPQSPGDPPAITGEVLNDEFSYLIMEGVKKPKTHRNIWVNRLFNNSLILSMATSQSCLNVIDGKKYELPEGENPLVRLVASYSRIDRIDTQAPPARPPEEIFGAEPAHTWCYYYQKAMLARQTGDWQAIARLGDEVQKLGFTPGELVEWMPFVEGYASSGQLDKAKKVAEKMRSLSGPLDEICRQLKNPPTYPDGYAYEQVINLLCANTP